MRKGSLLVNRDILVALHLSAFGADILDRKADIELVPITVFIGSCGRVRIAIPRSGINRFKGCTSLCTLRPVRCAVEASCSCFAAGKAPKFTVVRDYIGSRLSSTCRCQMRQIFPPPDLEDDMARFTRSQRILVSAGVAALGGAGLLTLLGGNIVSWPRHGARGTAPPGASSRCGRVGCRQPRHSGRQKLWRVLGRRPD
jgi:hypothetical protein